MSDTSLNLLALQIREAKLPESEAVTLETVFLPFFKEAQEWKTKAEALVVTSIEDKETMKEARKARLILKGIRVNVENRRKELKEDSLRKGKLIDAMANIIKAVIEPIEEHLDKQEKFAELQEQLRKQALKDKRTAELVALNVDTTICADLGEMPEESYTKLLESSRAAFQLVKEAAEKAEKERIAKEEADAAERERMRVENERLKKEADAREKALEAERKKAQEEREKAAAEQKKKDDEHKARLEAERLEKKKVEDELAAKKREEERIERERKAAQLKAERAPDKEKLLQLADSISGIRMPEVSSPEAKAIVTKAVGLLSSASTYVKTQSLAL